MTEENGLHTPAIPAVTVQEIREYFMECNRVMQEIIRREKTNETNIRQCLDMINPQLGHRGLRQYAETNEQNIALLSERFNTLMTKLWWAFSVIGAGLIGIIIDQLFRHPRL